VVRLQPPILAQPGDAEVTGQDLSPERSLGTMSGTSQRCRLYVNLNRFRVAECVTAVAEGLFRKLALADRGELVVREYDTGA
jgi:hypothetical protein